MKPLLGTGGGTGALETSELVAEQAHCPGKDVKQSEATSAGHSSGASKESTDYKSSWQRWQNMPGFLEQRRQQLLQKSQLEKPEGQRPTQEALDFIESLLAGTEPEEEDLKDSLNSTSNGAAQLQDAARRLQEQAEALRSLRQGSLKASKTKQPDSASVPSTRHPTITSDASGAPKSFEETFEQREASAEARRLQHQRKLQELETAAALEQEQLQAEIEREQHDAAARRDAQQAWFEEFSQNAQKKKEAAERDARARAAFGERDNYWRTRWWRYVPKSDDESQSGRPSDRKQSKPPNFRAPWEKSKYFSGRKEDWNFKAGQDSPPSSTTEASPILRELLLHREEPLQSRKKIWRALCLRWHPDKSEGRDKDLSTRIFQQLSELKPWFLPEA